MAKNEAVLFTKYIQDIKKKLCILLTNG